MHARPPRGDQIALEIAGTRAGGIRNDQQKLRNYRMADGVEFFPGQKES